MKILLIGTLPKAEALRAVLPQQDNIEIDYSDGEEVTFQLVGDLTVRDVTVPMTFDVTATLDGNTITGVAIADSGLCPRIVSATRRACPRSSGTAIVSQKVPRSSGPSASSLSERDPSAAIAV